MGGARSPVPAAYAVGLLLAVNTLAQVDRQIVNILAEPIKLDLGLADWQIGALSGFAFAVLYTGAGLPLALWADSGRVDRARLLSASLAIWSGMTALCGAALNYPQLLLARLGVGLGEGGGGPSAHALISEYVPPARRAVAMGVYAMGIPIGKLLGLAVGGLLAHAFGWRAAFLLVGAPGLILATLCWLTLPDPAAGGRNRPPQAPPLATLRALAAVPTFWLAALGGSCMSFFSFGHTAFLGSFLIRTFELNVAQAGLTLGLAMGAAGIAGTWLGGQVTTRLAARDPRAYVLVPAAASSVGAILFVASLWLPSTAAAVAGIALATVLTSVWYGPIFALVQNLVPPHCRATAAALMLCLISTIALGFGPLAFGGLSDLFNHGARLGAFTLAASGPAEGLRLSLAYGSAIAVVSISLHILAARTLPRDLHPA